VRVIEITVSPKDETKVEARGFAGGSCREATKFVESALGRTTSEQLTGDYYAGREAGQDLRQST
jgi:hypothetical protein